MSDKKAEPAKKAPKKDSKPDEAGSADPASDSFARFPRDKDGRAL